MKSSNPKVMIECYRLLVAPLEQEGPDWNYPIHLGVTEAGEGEDGRIKSAIGIGSLLCDGLGDTIRVSLTEDSPREIEVCRDLLEQIPRLVTIQPTNGMRLLSFRSFHLCAPRRRTEVAVCCRISSAAASKPSGWWSPAPPGTSVAPKISAQSRCETRGRLRGPQGHRGRSHGRIFSWSRMRGWSR